MIAQAQSGTGKTATFVITILQQLEVESRDCQALVLAPTRELAQQVWSVYSDFCQLCNIPSGIKFKMGDVKYYISKI